MARKRTAKPAPMVTADTVVVAVRKGDFVAAERLAAGLLASAPTPEHADLLRTTLLQAAAHFELHNQTADLTRALDAAVRLQHPDADWVRAVAVMLAKAGRKADAESLVGPLNDPAVVTQLQVHHADWLVRTRNVLLVPPEWKAGYDAVTTAFLHYQAGKDDAAREALNAISLSSPFLEWKVLLRGLIAWSTNDDAKALENISRLNPARYPARLAAVVRAQFDTTLAQAQPALVEQGRRLRAVGLVAKLMKVRDELARSRKLGPAFKAVEAILPDVKQYAPKLLPKLADAFYFAIVKRGEQEDLAKHRKVFGPPPADPVFSKLEALVFEEIDQLEVALVRWAAYEGWLAGVPAGWSRGLADRARAMILKRMADLAADIEEDAADPRGFDDFDGFFGSPARRGKAKPKANPTDPTVYLKRAADLAPDWEPVALELFATAVERGDTATAEAAARRFLATNPQSVTVLAGLAELMSGEGQSAEALDLRRRALAVNPLDERNRHMLGAAAVAHARRLAIDGDLPAAEKLLDDDRTLLEAKLPTSYFALRAVLHRKAKRPAEADAATEAAFRLKTSRLVARLYLHANAVLLKLKPKEKTAAAKDYADALELPPTPGEAVTLLTGYDMFFHEGLKYTGQKTQEKKILDVLVRAAGSSEGSEFEFELLAATLQGREQYAMSLKVAAALMKRFPKNPVFPLVAAQAELGKSKGRGGYKVAEPLRKAKSLAEASTEERHKQLIPQIEDLLKASDPFSGLFGGFFG